MKERRRHCTAASQFIATHRMKQAPAVLAIGPATHGLAAATLAVFVPVPDDAVPPQLRGETVIDGVTVVTVTIGWF